MYSFHKARLCRVFFYRACYAHRMSRRLLSAIALPVVMLPSAGYPDSRLPSLQHERLTEASGLASSRQFEGLYWAINDGGSPPELFLLGPDGGDHGTVAVAGAENVDWEDLASFVLDGRNWLLIADIGDNDARRDAVTLYVVEEPTVADAHSAEVSWRIDFAYPDGAQDAEAVAVDAVQERILVLSKRRVPAVLYAIPLRPPTSPVIADAVGDVTTIEQPTRADIDRAPLADDWHWQPTGMDLAPDGAVILTYDSIWYFRRRPGTDPFATFQSEPLRFRLDGVPGAEAVAFDRAGDAIVVTAENENAPIIVMRIPDRAR